ncbi:DUF2147 domain-containing protein [Sphingomonas cannabina]|uniref:DUF2147 domain-containing protein n=1 Tax=Sphingomonas cannabina TaxID=2899123 RepID=UPI001F3D48B2|nr:DUF2147 domain-containing protein [Sphingomonas cannabina]UIJ46764.1 DUF2147 domain-containing protein [Sphingomonas cannabina]
MKLLLAVTASAAMLVAAAPAPPADITGLWATGSNDGRVQIYRCGAALCGRVVDAAPLRADPDRRDIRNADPKLRERRLKGLVVLQGFTGGPTDWKGGPVYDPETGSGASKGYLKLRPDGKLEIKGCVAFFCRTKVWTRAG